MKKILVVDDEQYICDLLQNRLVHHGYEVITAYNGIEAFAKAQDEKPDLILLDVNMPTMDGYQFIQEIKWKEGLKDIPVIVVSARSNTRELFQEAGVRSFISKPFDSAELLHVIDSYLKADEPLRKRLLIIDDECEITELLQERFENEGYEVSIAHDGQQGLSKLREEDMPDAIILDVMMPNMDGFQVCKVIKSNPKLKNIPVMLLTARTDKEDRKIGQEVQADAYMTKPFQSAALLNRIKNFVKE